MPVIGRPTVYDDQTVNRVIEYLETYEKLDQQIPSIQGLSRFLGVTPKTVHVWKNTEGREEFCNILEHLLAVQAEVLLNKGLTGEFNSTISKLILTKHGYHEKHEHMGEGGGPIQAAHYSITPVKAKELPPKPEDEDVQDV